MGNKHFFRGVAAALYLSLAFLTSVSEASGFSDKMRSFYDEARKEFFKQERELYGSSEPSAGLYNIYVFGQVVPIPDRFVLLTQGEKGYQFNSMPEPEGVSIEGVIQVGSYTEIKNGQRGQI